MMDTNTPTRRRLHLAGHHFHKMEVHDQWSNTTKDGFGFIDYAYLDVSVRQIVGLQVTTRGNLSSHATKILESPEALAWVHCGGKILLWCYGRKANKAGEPGSDRSPLSCLEYEFIVDPGTGSLIGHRICDTQYDSCPSKAGRSKAPEWIAKGLEGDE